MVPKATRKPKTSASTPTITGPKRKPPYPKVVTTEMAAPVLPEGARSPAVEKATGTTAESASPTTRNPATTRSGSRVARERHPSGRQQSRTQKGPAVTEAEHDLGSAQPSHGHSGVEDGHAGGSYEHGERERLPQVDTGPMLHLPSESSPRVAIAAK